MSMTANPVFVVYVISAVVLGLNLLVLANNTALSRAKATEVINPEDTVLNSKATVVYEAGNDRTSRYRRAHRNALENIPLFLITGLLLTLTGISVTTAWVLFGVFVVARVFHSIAYVGRIQPWRTASFAVGAIDQLVILLVLGYQVVA
ncbi:MAG: MAPEG family protein [Deltaproteobacteria bacterium]|nr:MAPEG family protein [Deltaproteobacteria bacterium]